MPGLEDISSSAASDVVSLDTLVRRLRRRLNLNPWEDTITANVASASTAAATVGNPDQWTEGDVMEFDDGTGDVARVTSAATGGNDVPLKRNHVESTGAAHTSGCAILKNPRLLWNDLSRAITDVCIGLYPEVWITKDFDVTPSTTTTVFNVPNDFEDIVGASQLSTGSVTTYMQYGHKGELPIKYVTNLPGSGASSTVSLVIPTFYNTTNDLKVYYQAAVSASTVQEGDMADLVITGAMARILHTRPLDLLLLPPSSGEQAVGPLDWVRSASDHDRQFAAQKAKWGGNQRGLTGPIRRFVRG